LSAKRKLAEIKKLPSGKEDNADRKYEDAMCQLMASLLYPHLDFATDQSRTDSGVNIRDLIYYNNRTHEFLKEIFDDYGSRQLVMELKNVAAIDREHINQLNRYIADDLGRFGVLVTRHELDSAKQKNTIDLWSGQRRCIISLTDADVEQMVELFESKQRLPLDVLKKKYVQFRRKCPS
jgi:DNA topoisomerase VI subunit A